MAYDVTDGAGPHHPSGGEGDSKGAQGGPKASAADVAREREALQRLMEEYYKLDYEGTAGGIQTRFRCYWFQRF